MSTTMSITRALATLTKVESKIETRIGSLTPLQITAGLDIGEVKNKVIPGSIQSVDDYCSSTMQDFAGIGDLMAVRDEIKSKIIESNAVTTVKIGEKEMTVAQAIDMKRSIQYKELLLAKLKSAYNHSQQRMAVATREFEARLETARAGYVSRDKAPTSEQLAVIERPIRESMTPDIADPLHITKQIRDLETEIEDFKSNVDFALSESNAKTEIAIEGSL
uniref:Tail fiber protein n=2 Tax=unclassified Seunavirus TaxID=2494210 RepID=A0AAU8GFW3_9CAUD